MNFDGAADDTGSQSTPAVGNAKAVGTQRKCANCGQVGHIKTNKKYFDHFIDHKYLSSASCLIAFHLVSLLSLSTTNAC